MVGKNKSKKSAVESEEDFYSSGDESNKGGFALNKAKDQNNRGKKGPSFDPFAAASGDEESDNENAEESDEEENELVDAGQKKSSKTFLERAQETMDSEDDEDEDDDAGKADASPSTNVANDDDDDDDDQYFGFVDEDEDEKQNGENERRAKSDSTPGLDKEEVARAAEQFKNNLIGKTSFGTKKVKKLTPQQLQKEEQKIKRTVVVYLSSLPPYMKPQKLKQVMGRFGEVGRLFLKPEDPKVYKSRIKSGGNKKKKFEEGWVEFLDKKDAKLAASTLNGNILGGKKRSFYHDDVMNVKYLKGFKWFDLTNALNREVEVRESKKQAELSQAHKLNKAYIKNVETSKTINRVKQSKKRKGEDAELPSPEHTEIRRTFKQRNVATNRANADSSIKAKSNSGNLDNVLNKIF